ncbi:MAG: glycosyltransferase [Planctomycetota bacterium]
MKIHVMNSLVQGGAANAAKQLTRSLQSQNVDASLFYCRRFRDEVDDDLNGRLVGARWTGSLLHKLQAAVRFRLHRQDFKRAMKKRPSGLEIFSSPAGAPLTPWPPTNLTLSGSDVLHLHWVAKMIDYPSFFRNIPSELPIVWTLHDMNPFTGGCHFSVGCDRFTEGCGSCPQLLPEGESPQNDISRSGFDTKATAIRHLNLHVVAPSRWLIEQAQKSPLFAHARSFRRIPYGLADECFDSVISKDEARRQLDIESDTFVFCFGAADVAATRKGAHLLLPAITQLAENNPGRKLLGLVFGGGQLPESSIPIRSFGFLKGRRDLMRIFSACDVFVVPSLEDNLPITAMEAMAGGAAMLGFNTSGVPDLVIDGVTGRLAPRVECQDLARLLIEMARDLDATREQGLQAKAMADKHFRAEREADDYIRLYNELLST